MTVSGSTYSHKYVRADIAGLVVGGGPAVCVTQQSHSRGSDTCGDLQSLMRTYVGICRTGPNSPSRGALSGGSTPAVPCHTDPGGNPCTPAGGRPVCRMESLYNHTLHSS